ncbi:MAG: AAA family ATPase [Deltaproteobacteria bacterium]|nr:AAA family ATPase [Deltaproteobacteria bacterium]
MGSVEALPAFVDDQERSLYNRDLHKRFMAWFVRTNNSPHAVAAMMGVPPEKVHAYIEKQLESGVMEFQLRVKHLLAHREHVRNPHLHLPIVDTVCRNVIHELGEASKTLFLESMYIGPTGCGKSEAIEKYRRENPNTIIVRCKVTKGTLGAVLSLIAESLGCAYWGKHAVDPLLDEIIDRLHKWPEKLLIIDDSHFLSWEALEGLRSIYDEVGVGILYVGQQEFYDRLSGKARDRRGRFIYEQILSRISLKRVFGQRVLREDVRAIVDAFCPGLDKRCVDFLHRRASGLGKFRAMVDVLKIAMQLSKVEEIGIDLTLLRQANRLTAV